METFDPRVSYNKTSDTDVKYTGNNFPSLGINTGDKLSSVLAKVTTILSNYETLAQRVTNLEQGKSVDSSIIKANSLLFDLVDHSEVIVQSLENKTVNLEVKNSSILDKVEVSFDFADGLDQLDSKYVPVGVETSIRTYDTANKLLGSSSSRTGVMTISKQTGPVLVTSRVNLKTPNGDQILTKSFYLPTLTPQTASGTFKVTGISAQEAGEITQKQLNEIVTSNLSKVLKDISALEKKVSAI